MSLLTSVQMALDQRDKNLQAKSKGFKLTPDLGLPLPEKKSVPTLGDLVRPKAPVLTGQVPPTPAGKQSRQADEAMRRRGKGVRIQRTGNVEADAAKLAAKNAEVQPYTDPALMELGGMVRGLGGDEDKSKQLIYRGQRIMGERGIGPQEAFDLMMGKKSVEASSGMPDGREAAMRFIRGAEAPMDPNAPMNDPLNMIHNAIGRAYSTVTGQPWEDIDPRSELSENARNLFMTGVYSTPVLGVIAGAPELLNMVIAVHQAPDKGAMVQEMAKAMGEEVNVSGVDWTTDAGALEGFRRIMNIPMAVTQLYDVWRLGKAIAGKRARTPALPEPETNVPFQATEPGAVYGQKVEGVEPGSMPLSRGGKGSTATSQIPDGSPTPKVEAPNSSEIPNGLIPEKSYKFSGAKEPSPSSEIPSSSPGPAASAEMPRTGVREDWVKVEDVGVDTRLQYKTSEVTDRASMTSGKLKDVDVYDRAQGGTWTLWRNKEGKLFALNSHHRRELANRASRFVDSSLSPEGMVDVERAVPARILDEVDGWTAEKARQYGAIENIRDGKGTALDAVSVLREMGIDGTNYRQWFADNGVNLKDRLLRNVQGVLGIPPEGMGYLQNGKLSEDFVAGVGKSDLDARTKVKVLEMAASRDDPPATFNQGQQMAQRAKGKLMQLSTEEDGGFGLFGGDEDFALTLANLDVESDILLALKKRIAATRKDLIDLPSELFEGENLDVEGRKQKASVLGETGRQAVDSVEYVTTKDADLSAQLDTLAREVVNGRQTIAGAVRELEAGTIDAIGRVDRSSGQIRPRGGEPQQPGGPVQSGVPGADVRPARAQKGAPNTKLSGRADAKTLAKIAGVGATGAILATGVARGEIKPDQALGVAAGATLLAMGFKGAKAFARKHPGLAAMALPPEDAARLLRTGNTGEAIAGNALDMVLNVEQRHSLDAGETIRNMRKVYEETYGKGFEDDPKWRDRDEDIRSIMEKNLEEGRPWSEGLSDQEMKVVQWLKENVGDPILDRAERAGVMPKVVNNGKQSAKMVEGETKIRLTNGATGTYLRAERLADGAENLIVKLDNPPKEVAKRTKHLQMAMPEEIVLEPGTTFYRQFDRIGEAFVPRIPKPGFYDKIRAIKDRKGREALVRMLKDQNPGRFKGMDTDEILGTLDGLDEGLTMDSDVSDWLANLDTERQLKLARFEYVDEAGTAHTFDPYQSSHLGNWIQYADRSLLRVNVAEVTGTPNPGVIGQYIRSVPDPILQGYLKLAVGRILGLGDSRNGTKGVGADLQKIASSEGALQTVAKLTGGTTVISQLSDLVQVGTEAGFRKTAKALWEVARDADLRDEYAMRAAADQNFLAEFRGTDHDVPKSVGGKIVKGAKALGRRDVATALPLFADAVMTGLGIRAMDKAVKATTLLTAQREAMRLLELGKAGKLDAVGKRKLERLGLTSNDARNGAAALDNREVQYRFTGAVRRSLMYTGTPDSVPVWASGPLGSMAFRFRKPALFATRFLVRNVANEASAGNWQPMARFILGAVGVGQVSTMLKDLVRGEKDPLANTFFNKQDAAALANLLQGRADFSDAKYLKSLGDLLWVAGKNMYDAGALGLPGDATPYNRRATDIGKEVPDPWQALTPLTAETAVNGLQTAGKIIANENWGRGEWELGLKETVADITESVEREVVPLRRFMDFTGLRPEVSKIRKGERELRKLDRRQKELLDRGDLKGAEDLVKEGSQFQEAMKLKARVEGPAAERKKIKDARRRSVVPLSPSDAAKLPGLNKDGTRER